MLADFYILRLWNNMKTVVQKNDLETFVQKFGPF